MPEYSAFSENEHFAVLTVVSPVRLGGEDKDQDRAGWYGVNNIAVVADGVSSSPFAAKAADLAVQHASVLFRQAVDKRLGHLCDLLNALRAEASRSGVPTLPPGPPAMHDMLRDIVREKMTSSYQTTLSTACFTPSDNAIDVDLVCVGDSAFFAFQPGASLLASSLGESLHAIEKSKAQTDCLPVRVVCNGNDQPGVLRHAGITNLADWVICQASGPASVESSASVGRGQDRCSRLRADQPTLLVPQCLFDTPQIVAGREYEVPLSRTIRTIAPGQPVSREPRLEGRGSATTVLPDHFRNGRWLRIRDRFPKDAQFVISTDGFYSAFEDTVCLWQWLLDHQRALSRPASCARTMALLHRRLHLKCGDDDISFVWIHPKISSAVPTRPEPPARKELSHAS